MGIRTTKDKGQNLTVHDVKGPVSEADMDDALEKFYMQDPTTLLLWDMSQAEVSHVTPERLQKFIKKSAELEVHRQGGRTAIVASEDLQFGLARMSEIFAEIESVPYSFNAFRSREEALQWLKSADIS